MKAITIVTATKNNNLLFIILYLVILGLLVLRIDACEPALGRYLEGAGILQIMKPRTGMLNLSEVFVDGDEAFTEISIDYNWLRSMWAECFCCIDKVGLVRTT